LLIFGWEIKRKIILNDLGIEIKGILIYKAKNLEAEN